MTNSSTPQSLGWSCACCRCASIPVSIHWTFFFVWILQIIMAVIFNSNSWKYIVYIATLWGPVLALTVLLHEYGHVIRNRSFGGTCTFISLWPLGGFSNTNIQDGTCLQEFWTAFCGPIMHLPQMVVWVVVMALSAPNGLDYYQTGLNIEAIDEGGAGIWFGQLAKGSIDLNLMVCVMNFVVPAYPLDAARMLASMSVHCGLSVMKAAYLLLIVGGLMGLGALIWGIVALINGGSLGMSMLFIGLFLLWTTWSMYKSVQSNQILQHPIFQPDCYNIGRRRGSNLSSTLTSPSSDSMSRPPPRQRQQPKQKSSKSNPQQKKTKNPKRKSSQTADDHGRDLELGQNKPKNTNKKSPSAPTTTKKFKPGKVMMIKDEQKPKLNGKRVKLIQRPEGTKNKWEVELLDSGRRLVVPSSKLW